MNIRKSCTYIGRALMVLSGLAFSWTAQAEIPGLETHVIDLYAKQAQINTPDGDSLRIWGFATTPDGPAQYPGPTLIVEEGRTVMVTVHNVDVPQPVSLVFPGQSGIQKTCDIGVISLNGCHGTLAEGANVVAADGGAQSITYEFVAQRPGTFLYESGENPQIQVEMGLAGALIVRPTGITATGVDAGGGLVYNDPATAYDKEYLFFMSEMDPKLHYLAENDALDQWDNANYQSVLFFFNGRNAPDTLAPHFVPEMPHQPYGSLVTMFPGQRVLLRVINVGRNQHPLHTHGNHFRQVARDGFPLNVQIGDYTQNVFPGSTADLIFEWTGKNMGWDIYNPESPHSCVDTLDNRTGAAVSDGYDDSSWEWCADHGKTMPVVLPENQDLGFGGFYGGSPYLGDMGTLPVGEGGLNPSGGMAFMWHSHSERELTNNDIYPGGMLTMMIVNRRQ